ncbi:hypothetical protein MIR68_012157 [Amoeboaphelidium protococcarum]|nr:hypothetical protein MIR68_012157 [Amoeboaphelidium protococcarum]
MYVQDSGNLISRQSTIVAPQNIVIQSQCIIEQGAHLRGDLKRSGSQYSIMMGSCNIVESGVVVRPPSREVKGTMTPYPCKIGNYVRIGKNTTSQAAIIGNNVYVGSDCVLGPFCVVKDCVIIDAACRIPPYYTVSPFTRVSMSSDGKLNLSELHPHADDLIKSSVKDYLRQYTKVTR